MAEKDEHGQGGFLPKKVYQIDPKTLGIIWDDGKECSYLVKLLR